MSADQGENMKIMTGNNGEKAQRPLAKDIAIVLIVAATILLVQAVAMQFNPEMIWTASDFILAALLIVGAGLTYVFASRLLRSTRQRVIFGILLALAFLLVWLELAVGLIGSPISGS